MPPSAAPAASSSIVISNDPDHHASFSWMLLCAAAAGVATCATSVTRLEEVDDDNDDDDDAQEELETFENKDPYDNLPEEDEPTHCSICLTYRQGPCRPYWRKVEACTKDHELSKKKNEEGAEGETTNKQEESTADGGDNKEGGEEGIPDTPCLKYMLPWIDCATGLRNLYSLIELDTNYTAGIVDLEKQAVETLCWAPTNQPQTDWTAWKTYVLAHEDWKLPPKKKKKTKSNDGDDDGDDSNNNKVSLWKTLDHSKDPEVIEIETKVPIKQGEGILECVYALDQDGNVLGFTYGTRPSEAFKPQQEQPQESGTGKEEGEKSDKTELKVRLLPNVTRNIIIKASYTQPQKEGAKEDDPFEAHIYQSKRYSLKKMAKEG